jgi:hypothetical protein
MVWRVVAWRRVLERRAVFWRGGEKWSEVNCSVMTARSGVKWSVLS